MLPLPVAGRFNFNLPSFGRIQHQQRNTLLASASVPSSLRNSTSASNPALIQTASLQAGHACPACLYFNSLLDGHGLRFSSVRWRDGRFYRASGSSLPVALQYTPKVLPAGTTNGDRQVATVVGFRIGNHSSR